jgi:hypothetical protein
MYTESKLTRDVKRKRDESLNDLWWVFLEKSFTGLKWLHWGGMKIH